MQVAHVRALCSEPQLSRTTNRILLLPCNTPSPFYDLPHFSYSFILYILIYLLTAIGLTPGGSSTVHIYTQTIHRTIQLTSLVGRLSGIRIQNGQTKSNDGLTA